MGMGFPDVGEGWWRTAIGDEVFPQGVSTFRFATWVKPGNDCRPVPPMTAMWIGSAGTKVRRCRGSEVAVA